MNAEQQPGAAPPAQPPPVQPPPEQAAWGAPPPPPPERSRRWSTRQIVVAVAVALGIAAGGGVAGYAVSGSTSQGESDDGSPAEAKRGGPAVYGGPMAGLQHGEFQSGEVTDISDTAVTVKSEDGYERTYTIDEDTQLGGEIETGDDVMVMASVDGDTATAVTVVEQGVMKGGPDGPRGELPGDGT